MKYTIITDVAVPYLWSRRGANALTGEIVGYRVPKNSNEELLVLKHPYRASWQVLLTRETKTIRTWTGDYPTVEAAIIANL